MNHDPMTATDQPTAPLPAAGVNRLRQREMRNFACALLLASSAVILYSLWFLLAALSIWFVKVWNATEVLRYVLVAGRYPVSAYPAGLRTLFTLVLPVAFLTTVPAEAILGRVSGDWAFASLGVAAAALGLSRWFWQYALRYYTSASS